MAWSIDNATKGGSNLLSHITEAHIRPNSFESMNVKRVRVKIVPRDYLVMR